jgi:hypothetical protein
LSTSIAEQWEELFDKVSLEKMVRSLYLRDVKSRGGVKVPKPVDPLDGVLEKREVQRHHIPPHLYNHGNIDLQLPQEPYGDVYIRLMRKCVADYDWDTTEDPLVLCVRGYIRYRDSMLGQVKSVMRALQHLNEKHETNHTVDWWYQPPGQAQGHALIAIRLNGLYELTWGD